MSTMSAFPDRLIFVIFGPGPQEPASSNTVVTLSLSPPPPVPSTTTPNSIPPVTMTAAKYLPTRLRPVEKVGPSVEARCSVATLAGNEPLLGDARGGPALGTVSAGCWLPPTENQRAPSVGST